MDPPAGKSGEDDLLVRASRTRTGRAGSRNGLSVPLLAPRLAAVVGPDASSRQRPLDV